MNNRKRKKFSVMLGLKKILKERKITQVSLAMRFGVGYVSFSNGVNGFNKMPPDVVKKLCDYLNIKTDDLLYNVKKTSPAMRRIRKSNKSSLLHVFRNQKGKWKMQFAGSAPYKVDFANIEPAVKRAISLRGWKMIIIHREVPDADGVSKQLCVLKRERAFVEMF